MKSAIEKVYFGALASVEKRKFSKEQEKCLNVIIECDKKLTELFQDNQEAGDIFERFKWAMDETAAAEALSCYKEGFRNGFQIALDAIKED